MVKTFLGLDMTEDHWPRSFSPRTLAPRQIRPMQLSRFRELKDAVGANGECDRALTGAEAPDSDRSVRTAKVSSYGRSTHIVTSFNLRSMIL